MERVLVLAAMASSSVLALTGPAMAQDSVEEVVVTATRRDASLQDVPIAITAVTGEQARRAGVRDIRDLTRLAPTLHFTVADSETNATARLRGVGTNGSNPGLESAVGVFVDGVYRSRNGVALTDLGEIDQVEVLRGPQGTLFGRNTSAGLISIRTAAPLFEPLSGVAEVTYGSRNEARLGASLTGELVADRLAFRLFGARSTRDGLIKVIDKEGDESRANDRDAWAVRGQLAWRVSDDIDVRLIADYAERDEICCAAQIYNPASYNGAAVSFPAASTRVSAALGGFGPQGLAALSGGGIGDRTAFANRRADQLITDQGVSAEVNWQIGDLKLVSVSAYRDWRYDQGQDADFTALDLWFRQAEGPNASGYGFKTFTQEFRLSGVAGRVDWLAGAFFSDERLERDDGLTQGADFGRYFAALTAGTGIGPVVDNLAAAPGLAGAGVHDRYRQEARSAAIFTHNIISLTDALKLTLGARFTREEKTLSADFHTDFDAGPTFRAGLADLNPALAAFGNCNPAMLPGGAASAAVIAARAIYCVPSLRTELDGRTFHQERVEEEWSGVASLQYEISEALTSYASFSRGYKAGGFNLDRSFAGVTYSGASVTGVSLDTSFPAEFVNAYEIGLKASWPEAGVRASAAVFRSEYENFQLNTFNGVAFQVSSIPEVVSQGAEVDVYYRTPIEGLSTQLGVAYAVAEYGQDTGWVEASANPLNPAAPPVNFRLPGGRLSQAPMWSTTASLTYQRDLTDDLRMTTYLDGRYASRVAGSSDLDPAKDIPGYYLINARLALATQDDRVAVEVWGRNLLNEDFAVAAFNVPLQSGAYGAFLGEPRAAGVTLRLRR